MFSVADSLKQKGLIADIYGPYSRSLDNYDAIVHFSVHGGGLELLEKVSEAGKPILLLPNVWICEKDSTSIDLIHRFIDLSRVLLFKSVSELENFCEYFPEARKKKPVDLSWGGSVLP